MFDGSTLFSESFANVLRTQLQSETAPAGVELAGHADLEFGGRAVLILTVLLTLLPIQFLPTLNQLPQQQKIDFFIVGEAKQSLDDESWAMDNLQVSISTQAVAVAYAMLLAWVYYDLLELTSSLLRDVTRHGAMLYWL